MKALVNTGALFRLALRRDRIKLPAWMLGIVGIIAVGGPAVKDLYATAEQQVQYATTTAPSVVARMLGGPVDGPNIGSVMMVEYFLFASILVAFMSILTVIRHTRQNEETGRSELLGSGVVGRHAALAAALTLAVIANILVALAIAGLLIAIGLPTTGVWAMALSLGGVGIVFGGVAAVAAQVVGSGRGASSLAGIVVGLAFLARAIGDGLGKVAENGLSVSSTWPSWLSPIGWGQQMHPFTDTNWGVLIWYGVAFVALVCVAFYLTAHRDVGLGMIPARRGPAFAPQSLLSPLGLAWRLQRTTLFGWAVGIVVLGVTLGAAAIEFKSFFENEDYAHILTHLTGGTSGEATDIFFAGMLGFMGMTMAGFALQAILHVRSEEANGQLEPVLSTSTGRSGWLMSHVICVVGGVILLALLAGLATGLAYLSVSGASWAEVPRLITATLVQVPAVLVLVGFSIAVFGWLPRAVIAATWGVFVFCVLLLELGSLLKLPRWTQDISPFAHVPAAPAEAVTVAPMLALCAVAILLGAVGFMFFRRRDVMAP